MSYNKVRNEKHISEKRAVFGAAKGFSDVLESESTQSFEGGCFFGDFADVPENGYRLALNMDSCGTALETRADTKEFKVTEAKRRVQVNDLLYGISERSLHRIGNASVAKSEGYFKVTCNFFAKNGETYTDPGVYITKELAKGKYLFRLYLGTGACPKIKIYENLENIQVDGKPEVLTADDGTRYVQAEFEAEKIIRIELIYLKNNSDTEVHSFLRPAVIDIGAAAFLGASEDKIKESLFEGSTVFEDVLAVPEGEAEKDAFAGGIYVFKKGKYLFSFKASSGECFLEYPQMPETGACAIYRYGSGFIAICENGQTVTTNDFAPGTGVKTNKVYTPVHRILYGDELVNPSKTVEGINLFNEYFYVRLLTGDEGFSVLPEELPVESDFCEAYDPDDMSPLPEGDVTLEVDEDGVATLTEDSFCYGMLVKLRVKQDSELGKKIKKFRSLLFSPEGSEVFPSVYENGHNIVLYGGENGAEFAVCALRDNAYAEDGKVLLSENTEKITAVLRYSEDFLVFSPHYIRRMIISENEGGGFGFSMKNFKYDIGCDVPKSAVCVDDKIIYANSRAGVFYLDRFGFTERDVSRHVSANIETGENGLLLLGEAELLGAEAAVCDGKYFLRVGEFFYIWDFAHAVPSATEKASESRKLKWLVYSGLGCRRLLGADEEKMYFIAESGELASLERGTLLGSGAESLFFSREYSLSPFSCASVWKLSLSLAAKEACTVRLYFDGEESPAKYTVTPEGEKSTLCTVRPEARKCRRFAFSIHSFGGMRIDGVKIEYFSK